MGNTSQIDQKHMLNILEKVAKTITKEDLIQDLFYLKKELANIKDEKKRRLIEKHIKSKKEDIKSFNS